MDRRRGRLASPDPTNVPTCDEESAVCHERKPDHRSVIVGSGGILMAPVADSSRTDSPIATIVDFLVMVPVKDFAIWQDTDVNAYDL